MTAGYSFPSSARLTRKTDFDRVFRGPDTRLRIEPLRLLAVPNRMGGARLGLVVPKRVLKRAVDRNRVKRQLRESFRLARPKLPAWDIVVIVFAPGNTRRAADKLWQKAQKVQKVQ